MIRLNEVLVAFSLSLIITHGVPSWYTDQRRNFIEEETAMRLGAGLTLNEREAKVNERLMTLKKALVEHCRLSKHPYPPSIHFFKAKKEIDKSEIYRIIQKMPKGGALHVHAEAMTSLSWLIHNMTYDPNLYSKVADSGARLYTYSSQSPGTEWKHLETERKSYRNPNTFDAKLIQELSIWTDDPAARFPTTNDVWAKFNNYFISRDTLLRGKDREIRCIMKGIKEFFMDGVQYLELRFAIRSEDFFDQLYREIEDFKREHPTFIGVKFIIAQIRFHTEEEQLENVKTALALMKKYPGFIIGYDIVAQEDVGQSQFFYADAFLYPMEEDSNLPYFFHAGETDWTQGADMNLVDAVLLNTTRIGHGFAALRHPKVMKAVRDRKIAIEINPVSNQVLGLVADLRNHPGTILFAENDPVVVSSDDPPLWMASPMSHDFYMAFMALGGIQDDLRMLKQLAINSITFSAMSKAEKDEATSKWREEWTAFIDELVDSDFGRNTTDSLIHFYVILMSVAAVVWMLVI